MSKNISENPDSDTPKQSSITDDTQLDDMELGKILDRVRRNPQEPFVAEQALKAWAAKQAVEARNQELLDNWDAFLELGLNGNSSPYRAFSAYVKQRNKRYLATLQQGEKTS